MKMKALMPGRRNIAVPSVMMGVQLFFFFTFQRKCAFRLSSSSTDGRPQSVLARAFLPFYSVTPLEGPFYPSVLHLTKITEHRISG